MDIFPIFHTSRKYPLPMRVKAFHVMVYCIIAWLPLVTVTGDGPSLVTRYDTVYIDSRGKSPLKGLEAFPFRRVAEP